MSLITYIYKHNDIVLNMKLGMVLVVFTNLTFTTTNCELPKNKKRHKVNKNVGSLI